MNAVVSGLSVVIGLSSAGNGAASEKSVGNVLEIIGKAISEPVTDTEFSAAKQAVQADWSKRDVASFWLDADTYKIASPAADMRAIQSLTIDDVRAFADRSRQKPLASVSVIGSRPSTN